MSSANPPSSEEQSETWRRLERDHLAAVGMVASNWAYFEAVIDDWVLRLAHIEPSIGACITAQIAGSGRKLDAFISLSGFLRASAPSANDWEKFASKVAGVAERRNRVVHDPWFLIDPENPIRLEATARKKLRLEMILVPTTEVNKLAKDIEKLRAKFEDMARFAITSLPSTSPEK
ncbi:MAG: hypothetical protein ABSD21_02890 [Rhizomicrobium sp.]|jgi:hypothetical protein